MLEFAFSTCTLREGGAHSTASSQTSSVQCGQGSYTHGHHHSQSLQILKTAFLHKTYLKAQKPWRVESKSPPTTMVAHCCPPRTRQLSSVTWELEEPCSYFHSQLASAVLHLDRKMMKTISILHPLLNLVRFSWCRSGDLMFHLNWAQECLKETFPIAYLRVLCFNTFSQRHHSWHRIRDPGNLAEWNC